VILPAPGGPLRVIGLYVPSRDASVEKTERKRKWLAACDAALASNGAKNEYQGWWPGSRTFRSPSTTAGISLVIEYDFYRTLTGAHGLTDAFRHLHLQDAEYSWVGRTGDGYRYDHAFCSRSLRDLITACGYLHQPREDKLSDHSALTLHLDLAPPTALRISDPVTVTARQTLF